MGKIFATLGTITLLGTAAAVWATVDDGRGRVVKPAQAKTAPPPAPAKGPPPAEQDAPPALDPAIEARVDGLMAKMSFEEKIGQLLFLGFGGTVMDQTIASFLDEKKPGAVALFARNVKHLGQTMRLIREVRKHDPGGIPMFVSVDQEGGNVVRLKRHVTVLPSAMALGAADDVALAEEAGAALGRDLSWMGFNMNLAPVLDVNSNPNNPVIGTRSFGEDPAQVGRLGLAYVKGLQSQGVSAVAKHFPGHGDTAADSHHALPVLDHDKKRLDEVELVPFRMVLPRGLDALMTAHISLPKIAEEKGMPATVSANVLTKILREEIGYDGLLVTDGLEMAGIVDRYGSGEAAVRAVVAGADMVMVLWFKEKKNEVHHALEKAVQTGRISKARLDQSVRRILRTKVQRGLFEQELMDIDEAAAALKREKPSVALKIAKRAMTLVKNDRAALPLAPGQKVVVASTEPVFLKEMKKRYPTADTIRLKAAPTKGQTRRARDQIVRAAQGADAVVLGVLDGNNLSLPKMVQPKLKPETKVAVVNFGSPYALERFPDVDAYLLAFGFRWESEYAAAQAVVGDLSPTGKLPVTVGPTYKVGHGLRYPR